MLNSIFREKSRLMTLSLILVLAASFFACKKEDLNIGVKSTNKISSSKLFVLNGPSPYTAGTDITAILQSEVDRQKDILIPNGIYFISKPILKNGGTVNILSDGAVLQMMPSFPSGKKDLSAAFVFTNLLSARVEGLTIDGNRANLVNAGNNWLNFIMGMEISGCENVTLQNCGIINAPSISFNITNSNHIILNKCSSVNGMYHGVALQNCTYARVDSSKVVGIGNQGTDSRKGGIGILGIGGEYLTFTNNQIDNSSDTGTKTEGSNHVVWESNTIKNCGKDGIKFQNLIAGENPGVTSNLEFVSDAKIKNNTIDQIYNGRSDGSSLIQLWNAHDVEVTGNNLSGGSKFGQEDGICVWSNTAVNAANILVSGNVIKNTNRFIYLSKVSNATISQNNCENLVAPKSAFDGLSVEFSDDITITNNLFRRSATGSIDGFAAKMYQTTNFLLQNNQLQNAYHGLALRLETSASAAVIDNQMSNFSSYAVTVYSATPETVLNTLNLTGNTISKVGTASGYNAVITVDPTNLKINTIDLSNTKIIGNATYGDVALEVKASTKKVDVLNLTGFSVSGNVFYPATVDLTACQTIIN
ncbi:MAG TPA: right-handed parallel beta-helix repeat-containing protein [Pelobium sp.]